MRGRVSHILNMAEEEAKPDTFVKRARMGFFREEEKWVETKSEQAFDLMRMYHLQLQDIRVDQDLSMFPRLFCTGNGIREIFREFQRYFEGLLHSRRNTMKKLLCNSFPDFLDKVTKSDQPMFKCFVKTWLEEEGFDIQFYDLNTSMRFICNHDPKEGTLAAWYISLDPKEYTVTISDVYDISAGCAIAEIDWEENVTDNIVKINFSHPSANNEPFPQATVDTLFSRHGMILEGICSKFTVYVPVKWYVKLLIA